MAFSSLFYVYITSKHSSEFEQEYNAELALQFIEHKRANPSLVPLSASIPIATSTSTQNNENMDSSNPCSYNSEFSAAPCHRICVFVPTTSVDERHLKEAINVANTWGINDTNVYFVFDTMDLNYSNRSQEFCSEKADSLTNQHECIYVPNRKGGGFLARKTILLFKYLTINLFKYRDKCDWFLKTDTDSFVLLNEFYNSVLSCVDHNIPIYAGDVRGQTPPIQPWHAKQFGFAAGKGYVVSSGLLEQFSKNITMFDECFDVLANYWRHEDATFGFCIRWKLDLIVWQLNWWMPRKFNETTLLYDDSKYPPNMNMDNSINSMANIKPKMEKFVKYHEPTNYLLCQFVHHMHRHKNKRIMYEIDSKYRQLQKSDYEMRYNILNLKFRNFCVSRSFIAKKVENRKGQGEILLQIQNGTCKNEYQEYKQYIYG